MRPSLCFCAGCRRRRACYPLLTRLSNHYRLITPNYTCFGHSAAPAPSRFAYTFDHLVEVMIRIHVLEARHFAWDTAACQIADLVRGFP